jgi:hypothetical protein
MTLELPPQLNWLADIVAGQSFPQGDEDQMQALGSAWLTAGDMLAGIVDQVGGAGQTVLAGMQGPAGEQFASFVSQMSQSVPQLSAGAQQVGQLCQSTALQVQYAKYMIILQLAWTAEQIAEWSSTVAGLAAVPLAEMAGRIAVRSVLDALLRQVARSAVESMAAMVTMDAAVQTLQFLQGDRHSWDVGDTVQSVEMGLLTGAIGGLIGGLGHLIAPDLLKGLGGHIVLGATTGVVNAEVGNAVFGGDQNLVLGTGAGVVGALVGAGKGRFGSEHGESTPRIDLIDVKAPDFVLEGTKTSTDAESDPDLGASVVSLTDSESHSGSDSDSDSEYGFGPLVEEGAVSELVAQLVSDTRSTAGADDIEFSESGLQGLVGLDFDGRQEPVVEVFDDEGWRHSSATQAEWFDPSAEPVRPEQWASLREYAPVLQVDTEERDVLESSVMGVDPDTGKPFVRLDSDTGLIRYDVSRMKVGDQAVREYNVRLELVPDPGVGPDQLDAIERNALSGVDRLLNVGYRLPGGDQFHVNLEITRADPGSAGGTGVHAQVRVARELPSISQNRWPVSAPPEVLAHEVLHYLGVRDEYADKQVVLRQAPATTAVGGARGPVGTVHDDEGLMGADLDADTSKFLPRHAWAVDRVTRSQGRVPEFGPSSPEPTRASADLVVRSLIARDFTADQTLSTRRSGARQEADDQVGDQADDQADQQPGGQAGDQNAGEDQSASEDSRSEASLVGLPVAESDAEPGRAGDLSVFAGGAGLRALLRQEDLEASQGGSSVVELVPLRPAGSVAREEDANASSSPAGSGAPPKAAPSPGSRRRASRTGRLASEAGRSGTMGYPGLHDSESMKAWSTMNVASIFSGRAEREPIEPPDLGGPIGNGASQTPADRVRPLPLMYSHIGRPHPAEDAPAGQPGAPRLRELFELQDEEDKAAVFAPPLYSSGSADHQAIGPETVDLPNTDLRGRIRDLIFDQFQDAAYTVAQRAAILRQFDALFGPDTLEGDLQQAVGDQLVFTLNSDTRAIAGNTPAAGGPGDDGHTVTLRLRLGDWRQATDPRGELIPGGVPRDQLGRTVQPETRTRQVLDYNQGADRSQGFAAGMDGTAGLTGSEGIINHPHDTGFTESVQGRWVFSRNSRAEHVSTSGSTTRYVKGSSYRSVRFLYDVGIEVFVEHPGPAADGREGRPGYGSAIAPRSLVVGYSRENTRRIVRAAGPRFAASTDTDLDAPTTATSTAELERAHLALRNADRDNPRALYESLFPPPTQHTAITVHDRRPVIIPRMAAPLAATNVRGIRGMIFAAANDRFTRPGADSRGTLTGFATVQSILAGAVDAAHGGVQSAVMHEKGPLGLAQVDAVVVRAEYFDPVLVGGLDRFTRLDAEDVFNQTQGTPQTQSDVLDVPLTGGTSISSLLGIGPNFPAIDVTRGIDQNRPGQGTGHIELHKLKFTNEPTVLMRFTAQFTASALNGGRTPHQATAHVWMRVFADDAIREGWISSTDLTSLPTPALESANDLKDHRETIARQAFDGSENRVRTLRLPDWFAEWLPPNTRLSAWVDSPNAVLDRAVAMLRAQRPRFLGEPAAGDREGALPPAEQLAGFDNYLTLRNALNPEALARRLHLMVNGEYEVPLSDPRFLTGRQVFVRVKAELVDPRSFEYRRTLGGQMEVYYGNYVNLGGSTRRSSSITGGIDLSMSPHVVNRVLESVGIKPGFRLSHGRGVTDSSGYGLGGAVGGGSQWLAEFEGRIRFTVSLHGRAQDEPAAGTAPPRIRPVPTPSELERGPEPAPATGNAPAGPIEVTVRMLTNEDVVDESDGAVFRSTLDFGTRIVAGEPGRFAPTPIGPLQEGARAPEQIPEYQVVRRPPENVELDWTPASGRPGLPQSALVMASTQGLRERAQRGLDAAGIGQLPPRLRAQLDAALAGAGTRLRDFLGTARPVWTGQVGDHWLDPRGFSDRMVEVSLRAEPVRVRAMGPPSSTAYTYRHLLATAAVGRSYDRVDLGRSASLQLSTPLRMLYLDGKPSRDTLGLQAGYSYSRSDSQSSSTTAGGQFDRVQINVGGHVFARGEVDLFVSVRVWREVSVYGPTIGTRYGEAEPVRNHLLAMIPEPEARRMAGAARPANRPAVARRPPANVLRGDGIGHAMVGDVPDLSGLRRNILDTARANLYGFEYEQLVKEIDKATTFVASKASIEQLLSGYSLLVPVRGGLGTVNSYIRLKIKASLSNEVHEGSSPVPLVLERKNVRIGSSADSRGTSSTHSGSLGGTWTYTSPAAGRDTLRETDLGASGSYNYNVGRQQGRARNTEESYGLLSLHGFTDQTDAEDFSFDVTFEASIERARALNALFDTVTVGQVGSRQTFQVPPTIEHESLHLLYPPNLVDPTSNLRPVHRALGDPLRHEQDTWGPMQEPDPPRATRELTQEDLRGVDVETIGNLAEVRRHAEELAGSRHMYPDATSWQRGLDRTLHQIETWLSPAALTRDFLLQATGNRRALELTLPGNVKDGRAILDVKVALGGWRVTHKLERAATGHEGPATADGFGPADPLNRGTTLRATLTKDFQRTIEQQGSSRGVGKGVSGSGSLSLKPSPNVDRVKDPTKTGAVDEISVNPALAPAITVNDSVAAGGQAVLREWGDKTTERSYSRIAFDQVRWVLTVRHPDGSTAVRTFTVEDEAAVLWAPTENLARLDILNQIARENAGGAPVARNAPAVRKPRNGEPSTRLAVVEEDSAAPVAAAQEVEAAAVPTREAGGSGRASVRSVELEKRPGTPVAEPADEVSENELAAKLDRAFARRSDWLDWRQVRIPDEGESVALAPRGRIDPPGSAEWTLDERPGDAEQFYYPDLADLPGWVLRGIVRDRFDPLSVDFEHQVIHDERDGTAHWYATYQDHLQVEGFIARDDRWGQEGRLVAIRFSDEYEPLLSSVVGRTGWLPRTLEVGGSARIDINTRIITFGNGEEGLEVLARLRVEAGPGVLPDEVLELPERIRSLIENSYMPLRLAESGSWIRLTVEAELVEPRSGQEPDTAPAVSPSGGAATGPVGGSGAAVAPVPVTGWLVVTRGMLDDELYLRVLDTIGLLDPMVLRAQGERILQTTERSAWIGESGPVHGVPAGPWRATSAARFHRPAADPSARLRLPGWLGLPDGSRMELVGHGTVVRLEPEAASFLWTYEEEPTRLWRFAVKRYQGQYRETGQATALTRVTVRILLHHPSDDVREQDATMTEVQGMVTAMYHTGLRLPSGEYLDVEVQSARDEAGADLFLVLPDLQAGAVGTAIDREAAAYRIALDLGRRLGLHRLGPHDGQLYTTQDADDGVPVRPLWLDPDLLREFEAEVRRAVPNAEGYPYEDMAVAQEVLERVAYGEPGTRSGRLVLGRNAGMAQAQRTTEVNPNGTYRVNEWTMLPARWRLADVRFAVGLAMQFSDELHAPQAGHSADEEVRWTGRGAGIQFEGAARRNADGLWEATDFRPADSQPRDAMPAYLQPPHGVAYQLEAELSQNVVYGDRTTQTGAYLPMPAGVSPLAHGVEVRPDPPLWNGVRPAEVRFLRAGISPQDPQARIETSWLPHAQGPSILRFPATWTTRGTPDAVRVAYNQALEARAPRFVPIDGDGSLLWLGEAGNVRVVGLVRDGRLEAFQPASSQPSPRWDQAQDVLRSQWVDWTERGQDWRLRRAVLDDGRDAILVRTAITVIARRGEEPSQEWVDRLTQAVQDQYNDSDLHRPELPLVNLEVAVRVGSPPEHGGAEPSAPGTLAYRPEFAEILPLREAHQALTLRPEELRAFAVPAADRLADFDTVQWTTVATDGGLPGQAVSRAALHRARLGVLNTLVLRPMRARTLQAGGQDTRDMLSRTQVSTERQLASRNAEPSFGDQRHFEVQRLRDAQGDYTTKLVLRYHLQTEPQPSAAEAHALWLNRNTALAERVTDAVEEMYNTGLRLPNGDRLEAHAIMVDYPDQAHYHGSVDGTGESNVDTSMTWSEREPGYAMAYQVGQLLGIHAGSRQVPRLGTDRAAPALIREFLQPGPDDLERLWEHLRAVIEPEPVLRVPVEPEVEPVVAARRAAAARARIPQDVLDRILYGTASDGWDGLRAQDRTPGWAQATHPGPLPPNGAFRRVQDGRMALPAHLSDAEVEYAVRQSVINAERTGRLRNDLAPLDPEWQGWTWEGDHGGLRLVGSLDHDGVVTDFLVSGDQPGPVPGRVASSERRTLAVPEEVANVMRFGDRVQRLGVHQGRAYDNERFGVRVQVRRTLENGVREADISFLHQDFGPGDPGAHDDANWYRHADSVDDGPVAMFPLDWTAEGTRHAAAQAHAMAVEDPARLVRVLANGAHQWIGEYAGVRIQGEAQDGRITFYQPSPRQPLLYWPRRAAVTFRSTDVPIALDTIPGSADRTGDGNSVSARVRRVVFQEGDRGFEVDVRVPVVAGPGAEARDVQQVRDDLGSAAQALYDRIPRGDGMPLIRISMEAADSGRPDQDGGQEGTEPPAIVVNGPMTIEELGDALVTTTGIRPTPGGFTRLHRAVLAASPPEAPQDRAVGGSRGAARRAAELALEAMPVRSHQPELEAEPAPAPSEPVVGAGAPPVHVPELAVSSGPPSVHAPEVADQVVGMGFQEPAVVGHAGDLAAEPLPDADALPLADFRLESSIPFQDALLQSIANPRSPQSGESEAEPSPAPTQPSAAPGASTSNQAASAPGPRPSGSGRVAEPAVTLDSGDILLHGSLTLPQHGWFRAGEDFFHRRTGLAVGLDGGIRFLRDAEMNSLRAVGDEWANITLELRRNRLIMRGANNNSRREWNIYIPNRTDVLNLGGS